MHIFIICLLPSVQVSAYIVCRQSDQLLVEVLRGDPVCIDCVQCSPGFGATIPCKGTVPVPYNVSVTCKPCIPGTYSDSYSSESCKTCSKCRPDEEIVAKCSNISDTSCLRKPCPKGYYRNKTKCVPCSECCSDSVDEEVAQCVSQGIARSQTCRYQKRKPCASKCWYDEITVESDGKRRCQRCPVCSKDSGLTVPCGSVVREEELIACVRPTLGKTFVNEQGILQSCSRCTPGQELIVNCSSKLDTKCGGCKRGYFYNNLLMTCQECYGCCNLIFSDDIMKCIRERMLFAERNNELLITRQLLLFLQVQPLQTLTSDDWKIALGFIVVVVCFVFIFTLQRRKNFRTKGQKCDVLNLKKVEPRTLLHQPQSHATSGATQGQSKTTDTKIVDLEYPVRQNPRHVVFEKTGVEVLVLGKKKSRCQHLPSDLGLQATSKSVMPGFLEDGEIALSPVIAFNILTLLDGPVQVQIPHGANMVLSHTDWIINLKEFQNNKWVNVSQGGPGEHGIKNFVVKSNHVSFETDHFSTFAIVGRLAKPCLSALKRMKVAAFCIETGIGKDLQLRLYCFDDCEYSFEGITKKEKEKGGKLISSIDSLDFSIASEKDLEITVKDTKGWQLVQASPTKLSYDTLRNSLDTNPRCELVFHPITPGKISFFAVIALTHEPSGETVMYASTGLKKDPVLPGIQKYVSGTHGNDGVKTEAEGQVESDNCIIQM